MTEKIKMSAILLKLEILLLDQISSAYIEGEETTQDDEEFFKAFSAVQDLRKYLEEKEGAACTHS